MFHIYIYSLCLTLSTCRLKHIENIMFWEFWISTDSRLFNRTALNSSSSTTPMRSYSSCSLTSASRRSRRSICPRGWSGSRLGSSATPWSVSWWSSPAVGCSAYVTSSQGRCLVLTLQLRRRPSSRRWTPGSPPTRTTSRVMLGPGRKLREVRPWPILYLLTHLGNSELHNTPLLFIGGELVSHVL